MATQTILVVLLAVTATVLSNEVKPVAPKEETASTNLFLTSHPYYTTAVIISTVVLAGIVLVSLTALFFPAMAYRICYALGGCQNTMDAYVDELIGKQLGRARNVRSRSKRSMEYLEPLLVTLAKAYEEYGDQDVKKNLKTGSYYTK